jgi:hypothetical protein
MHVHHERRKNISFALIGVTVAQRPLEGEDELSESLVISILDLVVLSC